MCRNLDNMEGAEALENQDSGELIKRIAALQEANEELERERAWTLEQHRRWSEERTALVDIVRQLRARLASFSAEDLTHLTERNAELQKEVDALRRWAAELERAKTWYE